MSKGKVYLVGAGPGDYGLITLKGIDCIAKADIIIYDRLVNRDLLKSAKPGCAFVYVGKKSSKHIMAQEQINDTIAESAASGKIVVRLKGGDPFVFGRGGEEAELIYDQGIDFEIVPGVTSSIGGLAYAGIPVTHRDFASSFHVVTGHAKKDDSLDINWESLAKEKGTVVFLMGIGNIKHVAEMLISHGRAPETPVAFVSNATSYKQRTVRTNLGDAYECVHREAIKPPSLFVVGGVVSLSDKLGFYERKPLFGKTIILTRTRKKNSDLRKKIEELGGKTFELSTIDIKDKKDIGRVLIEKLTSRKYTHIALTSHNSVDIFFKNLIKEGFDFRKLAGVKIASVGKATSKAIMVYGLVPDIETSRSTGADLADVILEDIGNAGYENPSILFPCSEIASKSIEDAMKSARVDLDRVDLYTNTVNMAIKDELLDILVKEKIDYITFTSSSTVKYLVEILGRDRELIRGIKKVSIGSITSQTIRDLGFSVDMESDSASIDSMLAAILEDVKGDINDKKTETIKSE